MNKINLYDLIGKLAVAATQKTAEKGAEAPASPPAEKQPLQNANVASSKKNETTPNKAYDRGAVIEMLRRHDKKSREIDQRLEKEREKNETEQK